jgi:predicted amidohydrolase YtcJ
LSYSKSEKSGRTIVDSEKMPIFTRFLDVNNMKRIFLFWIWGMTMLGCSDKIQVDLLIYNALVYTVDEHFSSAEAFAVKDGRFIAAGSTAGIRSRYVSDREVDVQGAPVYPGFHDAHCHFVSLGKNLSMANLRGATTYDEVLDRIAAHYAAYPSEWLIGVGWDQNLWPDKRFPSNEELNRIYPNTPVVLKRVDGHAIVANKEAIRRVGLKPDDATIPHGESLVANGNFTGVFLENTADRFWSIIPEPSTDELIGLILRAAALCYQHGLTSVSDAGLPLSSIQLLDTLQQSGRLPLRVDAWIEPSEANFERFKAPYRTDRLTVSCLKLYMDGALGSRGAWMLSPYNDDPSTSGIRVVSDEQFMDYCQRAYDAGLQVATHCIGDAANQQTIKLYAHFLKGENDLRWRIEHAQILAPEDFDNFAKYSIVPSVQPTHATSDMFWAGNRVGDRLKGGYAYRELKNQLGWIPFGTDFPVEEVNPMYTFFAAVCRKNLDFLPEGGFQMENAVSREDALRAMTIWAAKASFDEDRKGSIEAGKWADFVVLDRDIMTANEQDIPGTRVVSVYISGEKME